MANSGPDIPSWATAASGGHQATGAWADFLWQYINLTPMGPFVANAPEPAKDAMEAQVAETWAPYVRDGRTPIDQPMVLATGVRS